MAKLQLDISHHFGDMAFNKIQDGGRHHLEFHQGLE